jgi:hypothetical protein
MLHKLEKSRSFDRKEGGDKNRRWVETGRSHHEPTVCTMKATTGFCPPVRRVKVGMFSVQSEKGDQAFYK